MERLALALVLAFVALCAPASAATFTVTSFSDAPDTDVINNDVCAGQGVAGNPCTLRAALQEAASNAEADRIVLPAGDYPLLPVYGQLLVDSSVTIDGAGARTTRIIGASGHRVMSVSQNLTLRDATIRGGSPSFSAAGGYYGGGILVTNGTVTLERVAVRDNTITATGATQSVGGGGIGLTGGSLALTQSLVADNQARTTTTDANAVGGGVYTQTPLTIRRSTVTRNLAKPNAGSVFSFAEGGGVYAGSPTVIEHSTITANEAVGAVSGIGTQRGGNIVVDSALTLSSSVIAGGNGGDSSPNCYLRSGSVTTPAPNLSDNAECLDAANVRNTPVKLTTLADNGGPTDTLLPAADSPALNGATGCGLLTTDQRGNALPAGPACDFGAVEYGADRAVTLQASKTSAANGEDVTLIASIQNAGLDHAPGETLTIDLPAGVTATTATSTLGTCTTGASIVCTLGALNRNAAATITATIRASGTSFAVTARRGGAVPDQSAANDTASVAISGVGGTGGAGSDRTAPAISGLKLAATPTLRKGAKLKLKLSEAAKVRVVAERLLPGKRKGSRCVAKGTGKRCVRVVKLTTTTVSVKAGAITISLPGKRLKRGSVRFTLVATDAAGNASKAARVTGAVRSR